MKKCLQCGAQFLHGMSGLCSIECLHAWDADEAYEPPPARTVDIAAIAPAPDLVNRQGWEPVLAGDSDDRKDTPIFSGVLNYFPLALAAVARQSKMGNDKHNPGQPLHWARGKSMDHADCIARHLIDIETLNAQGEPEHATALAWRALAQLQGMEERRLGKPRSRGSR